MVSIQFCILLIIVTAVGTILWNAAITKRERQQLREYTRHQLQVLKQIEFDLRKQKQRETNDIQHS